MVTGVGRAWVLTRCPNPDLPKRECASPTCGGPRSRSIKERRSAPKTGFTFFQRRGGSPTPSASQPSPHRQRTIIPLYPSIKNREEWLQGESKSGSLFPNLRSSIKLSMQSQNGKPDGILTGIPNFIPTILLTVPLHHPHPNLPYIRLPRVSQQRFTNKFLPPLDTTSSYSRTKSTV